MQVLQPISWARTKCLIYSDLYRYYGDKGREHFIRAYFMIPGFQYSVWMRLAAYFERAGFFLRLFYPIVWYIWACKKIKFGINIPFRAEVGPGLYIGHFGGIIVHPDCRIGRNCNISQGVTLGLSGKGSERGCPSLDENVYIGAGAVLIGKIHIGANVSIGANSLVTQTIPANAVVASPRAKIICFQEENDYVKNTDYYFEK